MRLSARFLAVAAAIAVAAQPAAAQQPSITPNYKDADIRQVIEAVEAATNVVY